MTNMTYIGKVQNGDLLLKMTEYEEIGLLIGKEVETLEGKKSILESAIWFDDIEQAKNLLKKVLKELGE